MPRAERSLESGDGSLLEFAAQLRILRKEAGSPTYRELARRAHYSSTTLSDAAGGRRLPSLDITLAYVRACGGDEDVWQARWHDVAAELARAEPAVEPAAVDDGGAPYVGLAAFRTQDAALFFGREAMVDRLLIRLTTQRFVALFGASGEGKSSVLHAGLILGITTDEAGVQHRPYLAFTPGPHPVEELGIHLAGLLDRLPGQLHAELAADPRNLHRLVRRHLLEVPPGIDLLVVVDQFEEVFTLCHDLDERALFIALLLTAVSASGSRVRVVLGVRSDFYPHCARHPDLVQALEDGQVLLGAMTVEELRRAVTRPAAATGCAVEAALLTQLVADAGGRAGTLPLVSHVLLQTWRRRRGNTLTLTGYQAAGGIRSALAQSAEDVYTSLSVSQQQLAKQVLLRLTALGDGTEDTKRRADRTELDGLDDDLDRVLHALADARLIILADDTVSITHEALLQAWPRLQRWLSTDRDGLRAHRQLSEAAQSWVSLDRDPGALYRGARLALAREWSTRNAGATMTAVEQAFLDTSIDQFDQERAAVARRHRQLRYIVTALSVLLVVALGASALALVQRREAVAQSQTAISRQLAAESLGLAGTEPGTAMLLAAQAYRTAPTTEARSALLSMSPHRGHLGKLLGHVGAASQVAFRPDGSALLSVGRDQTLSVWDTSRRTRIAALTDHHTWLTTAAVSPDGHTAATGGENTEIAIWDLDRRTRVATLTGLAKRVRDVTFSPDGQILATTSDNEVILWDVAHRTRLATLTGHTKVVHALAFSPDGRTLATASADSTVILWDLTRSASVATLPGHADGAHAVAFSPDGATLATGAGDTTAILWDVPTRTRLATFTHHTVGFVMTVAFSPDGHTLATAGDDTAVLLWDTAHRVLRGRLTGPRTTIYTMAFNPRTSMLAAGGEDGAILLWDPAQPDVTEHPKMVSAVEFSPDGRTIATASGNQTMLWNTADRGLRSVLTDGEVFTNGVAFSPDGRTLATVTQPSPCCAGGTTGNTLTLWNPDTGVPTHLTGHTGEVLDVAFSPDGQLLATSSVDRTVRIWDPTTGAVLKTLTGHDATLNGVAFSPDGRSLATAGHDQTVKIWDLTTGDLLAALAGHTGWVRTVTFSPDGRLLATAGHDQTVILWDVTTHVRLATITNHTDADFTGVAFSPDSHTLAYTSGEATVVLWDVLRHTITARLTGHTQRVHTIAFSPDGDTLASAGSDQTLILWDVDPEHAMAHLCAAAARDLTPDEWRQYLPSTTYTRTCTND